MAGRKNHLQAFGQQAKDLSGIEDPIERDFMFRSLQVEPFCVHCGKEIIKGNDDQMEGAGRFELELQTMSHTTCRMKYQDEQQQKLIWEKKKEEELRKNFDIEAYMERMMREREGK